MSELRIYEESGKPLSVHADYQGIRDNLSRIGVDFQRWEARQVLDPKATPEQVIEAYRESVDKLMAQYGFKSVDVISMYPEHPQAGPLREKFLSEHTHDEFEVRFFVEGQGLFYIHAGDKVYGTLCTRGDLISVPAGVTHWFDMGPRPSFKSIRMFITPEGWVASFTGDPVAERFPRLEAPHYRLAA